MELFKITCVTCKARLSVRNRDLVGQIIACPRCDSMVHVEAPATATESPAPQTAERAELAAVPIAFDEQLPNESPSELEQPPVDATAVHAPVALAKYKLIAWTLASFAIGSALGGIVILLRGDFATDNAQSAQTQPGASEPKVAAPIDSPVEKGMLPAKESTAEPKLPLPEEPKLPVVKNEASDATIVADEEPSKPQEPTDSNIEVEALPEVNEENANGAADRHFDPLALDPESLDLASLTNSSRSPDGADSEAVPNGEGVEESTELPRPSVLPNVRRDPEQAPEESPPIAEKKLTQKIPELKIKAMSLGNFLNLISQLGGVPVSVTPEQLQMAGITAQQNVSLDAKDISLAEALGSALGPLHLEQVAEGAQVIVVRKGAAKIREIDYPLDDLINSSTNVDKIADWVEKFALAANGRPVDERFKLDASAVSLRMEQPQQIQYRVLIFLERLRLARNLQPRSRFPVKRLAGSPAYAKLAERLGAPTTFTFSHYTPLNEIVRYWQRELDVPLLVDWPALAKIDLWPQSRIACAIENDPWQQALDHVLEPLGLSWRAVAGEMIEITSAEKVQSELQLELYPLARQLGADAERILEQANRIAERQSSELAQPPQHAIEYDPTGNVLIVLGSAPTQRSFYQWLVAESLASK